jgi:integrase
MNSLSLYSDLSPLDYADLADGTRRHYKAAILLLIASNIDPLDYEQLVAHAHTLPTSGKANLKAALKIMSKYYVNKAKTSDAPLETIQRFLWAIEAMNDAITVKKHDAKRNPHWLSQEQVDQIASAAMNTSMRDYIVIGLLLGAGLRCQELSSLTFDNISQIPYGKGFKDIITLRGKGNKKRDIPISPELAQYLKDWKATCKGGRVARRFYKGGKLGKSLDTSRIFRMVRKYGLLLGIEDLDPHDLRRSYGRLMYYAIGKDIMLIKELLGHNDIKVTQRYIGLKTTLAVDVYTVGGLQVAGD